MKKLLLLAFMITTPNVLASEALTTTVSAEKQMMSQQTMKLDLNSANLSQLEAIPGIGTSKAQAIIAYRDIKGQFTSLEQLEEVKGIGAKLRHKLAMHVHIQP